MSSGKFFSFYLILLSAIATIKTLGKPWSKTTWSPASTSLDGRMLECCVTEHLRRFLRNIVQLLRTKTTSYTYESTSSPMGGWRHRPKWRTSIWRQIVDGKASSHRLWDHCSKPPVPMILSLSTYPCMRPDKISPRSFRFTRLPESVPLPFTFPWSQPFARLRMSSVSSLMIRSSSRRTDLNMMTWTTPFSTIWKGATRTIGMWTRRQETARS